VKHYFSGNKMDYQDAEVHKEECVLLADKDGIIVSINNKFSEDFGYDLTDIVGQSFIMLFHPIITETIIKDLLHTLSNGEIWNGYLKRLPKTGESFWVHSTISPIESTSGFLSSCRKVLDEEIPIIDSLYPDILSSNEHQMVYIEATLFLCNKHHSFRVDADDMKELMKKVKVVVSNLISGSCTLDIILFKSNTLNLDNFTKLVEGYLPSIEK
jgi:PAS domain S-box-containing protein